jgi:hypothetical protein
MHPLLPEEFRYRIHRRTSLAAHHRFLLLLHYHSHFSHLAIPHPLRIITSFAIAFTVHLLDWGNSPDYLLPLLLHPMRHP